MEIEETIDGNSLNLTTEKIKQLKVLFPEVFTENKIDFKRLQDVLGDAVSFGNEHYELSWAGKAEARKEVQKHTTATLTPDKDSSIDFDTAENVFIEGENLEVLRVLQKSYFGKIKMIYIDPPYNTGNDSFVYPDDYSERRDEYNKRTGIANEEGFLNKQDLWKKNTKESGQFHSVWLSMMYPRLYLARNLLREDGVIFVSIDDNEQANLKLLMDEIFGQENFIVQVIWKKRSTPPNDKIIGANHEYLLCFAKNLPTCILNLRERSQEQINRYQNPDNHIKGLWTSGDLMANVKGGRYVQSLYFPIVNPNTGEEHYPSNNGNWRFNKEKISELLKNKEIYFGEDGMGRPKLKRFLSEVKEGVTYPGIWDFVPLNAEGSSEMIYLLGNMNIFDNPKPTGLLKELIKLGSKRNDIVLDFFAGSGTTAHSVLELNNEDNGNRKFILVQLPEPVDESSEAFKAGYKTIADICKARIKKVIQQLSQEKEGQINFIENKQPLGFKAYHLAPSNFKQWRGDIQGKENILQQLEMFTQNTKPASEQEAMLTELLLKAGKPLTTKTQVIQAAEGKFYYLTEYNTCICLQGFGLDTRNSIYTLKPKEVIVLNSLFDSDEFLSNTKLEFQEADIKLTLV